MDAARSLLIVSRRFWPTITDDSLRVTHWIERLNRAGIKTRMITQQVAPAWSSNFSFDRTPVTRLARDNHPLRAHRWSGAVAEQVRKLRDQHSLVYFDSVDQSAADVLKANGSSTTPIVVRFDQSSSSGEQPRTRLSKVELTVLRKANAIVAPDPTSEQRLRAEGIVQTPILRIDDWHGKCVGRSVGARRAARQILRSINQDLFVRSSDLVIVAPGELSRQWGVEVLVRAMQPIIESNRRIQLWILGDGPERSSIHGLLEDNGLHRRVAIPGVFTDMEQVLQVADLCVFPSARQGLTWLAPTCAVSNIPMIIADCKEARRFAQPDSTSMFFEDGNVFDLRFKIESWLRNATPLARSALTLQQMAHVKQEESDEFAKLFSICSSRSLSSVDR